MNYREKNLRDLRGYLTELLDEVDDRLDDLDEPGDDSENRLYLARSYLDDLDEKEERLENVGGRGSGGVTLALPITYNRTVEPGSRDERMMDLNHGTEQLFQDGVFAYIEGRYGASTITIAASLEGLLKYKMLEEDVNFAEDCALGCCVDRVEGTLLPEDSDVLEKAEMVRDIRNDVVHLNPEMGVARSILGEHDLLDQVRPLDLDEPMTVMDGDGNVREVPLREVSPHGAATLYPYRNASRIVIQFVKDIKDHLYENGSH